MRQVWGMRRPWPPAASQHASTAGFVPLPGPHLLTAIHLTASRHHAAAPRLAACGRSRPYSCVRSSCGFGQSFSARRSSRVLQPLGVVRVPLLLNGLPHRSPLIAAYSRRRSSSPAGQRSSSSAVPAPAASNLSFFGRLPTARRSGLRPISCRSQNPIAFELAASVPPPADQAGAWHHLGPFFGHFFIGGAQGQCFPSAGLASPGIFCSLFGRAQHPSHPSPRPSSPPRPQPTRHRRRSLFFSGNQGQCLPSADLASPGIFSSWRFSSVSKAASCRRGPHRCRGRNRCHHHRCRSRHRFQLLSKGQPAAASWPPPF